MDRQVCINISKRLNYLKPTPSSNLICRMVNYGICGSRVCNTAYSPESSTMEIGQPFEYTQQAKA